MTTSLPKVLSHRLGKKRGFTLLELVVALVVLGILAALAIPTYTTVIGNAKTAVATSDAISLASDAVALASESDTVATEAQFTTAASEDSAAKLASPANYSSASGVSSITVAVTEDGTVYDVNVSWPDRVNGAPYVTGTSGGSDSTTTTTFTAVSDPGVLSCAWNLVGFTSPSEYDGVSISNGSVGYSGDITDATISCTNVPNTTAEFYAVQPQDGGYELLTVYDADASFAESNTGFDNSSFSIDTNTAVLAADDSDPGALAILEIVWFPSLSDAQSYVGSTELTPSSALTYGLNAPLTGANLPGCSWTTTGVTDPSSFDTLWYGGVGVGPGGYNDGTTDVDTTCTNLPANVNGVLVAEANDGGYEAMTIYNDYFSNFDGTSDATFSPAAQSWDSNGTPVTSTNTGAVGSSSVEYFSSYSDMEVQDPGLTPTHALAFEHGDSPPYNPGS